MVYYHGGRYIQVPPDWIFPKKSNLRDIFIRFHIRDLVQNIPPLKKLKNNDLKHIKRGSPAFSDLKYLMCVFENIAQDNGTTTVGIDTFEVAGEKFGLLASRVYELETKNVRRREQFKWQTWVKKCRMASVPIVTPSSWG